MQLTLENLKHIKNLPGIYKITNMLSNLSYIGQSKHVHKRLVEHRRSAKGCLVGTSILKHGIENFTFDVLCYCEIEVLDEFETKFIALYNTVRPNGYNIALGGHGKKIVNPSTCKLISDRQKKLYETRPAPFKGRHHTEETKAFISSIHKGKKVSEKCRLASSERLKNTKGEKNRCNKKISIDGVEYYSMRHASDILDIKRSTVKYRCHSNSFPNYKIL